MNYISRLFGMTALVLSCSFITSGDSQSSAALSDQCGARVSQRRWSESDVYNLRRCLTLQELIDDAVEDTARLGQQHRDLMGKLAEAHKKIAEQQQHIETLLAQANAANKLAFQSWK